MKPLFLVGCPRSGTTLLRDILHSHTQICFPKDELQLLSSINASLQTKQYGKLQNIINSSPYGFYRGSININADDFEGLSSSDAFCLLIKIISDQPKKNNARYFGEKTPDNFYLLDEINQLYENPKIIFIMRNPYPVVKSMYKAWGKPFILGAKKWKDCYEVYEKHANSNNVALIKYEDLLEDPDKALAPIFDFLELPTMSNIANAFSSSNEYYGRAKGDSGINKKYASIKMTKSLYASSFQIDRLCEKGQEKLGYKPISEQSNLLKHLISYLLYGFQLLLYTYRYFLISIKRNGLMGGIKYRLKQLFGKYILR